MIHPHIRLPRARRAFTVVELLVVISIIAILAALLLPALAGGTTRARIRRAEIEISQLTQGIQSYFRTYSRYPVSSTAPANATEYALKGKETGGPLAQDYTYGTTGVGSYTGPGIVNGYASDAAIFEANNREVVMILMDRTEEPINTNHVKNPQQIKFLQAKMSGDVNKPGVGRDLVYRDPWGRPYIISMDLNYDDKCWDAIYRLRTVSQIRNGSPDGHNGLYNSIDANGDGDHFAFNGGVMVWSMGPDVQFSTFTATDASGNPTGSARTGPNADNVLSWK